MAHKLRRRVDISEAFDDFARATRHEWVRLAAHLYRRYALPEGVEPEDVVQEMLLRAWSSCADWQPGKMPLHRYVTWSAYAAARKWIHRQRNALRRDDRAPSRFPAAFGSYTQGIEDAHIEDYLTDVGEEDLLVDARVRMARVIELLEDRAQKTAMEAFWMFGSSEETVDFLLADPRIVVAFRLFDRSAAERLVARSIEASILIAEMAA